MSAINGQKMKELRKAKKLSLRELSQICGFSHSYIGEIEKGTTNPSLNALDAISKALGVHSTYLIEHDSMDDIESSENVKDSKIPVLRIVVPNDLYNSDNIITYITQPADCTIGEYFAYKAPDDSMENDYIPKGSILIVRKQENLESGEVALLVLKGKTLVRRIQIVGKNLITLIASSSKSKPELAENKDVIIVGRVMQSIVKF